jgi:four helix bundle protein
LALAKKIEQVSSGTGEQVKDKKDEEMRETVDNSKGLLFCGHLLPCSPDHLLKTVMLLNASQLENQSGSQNSLFLRKVTRMAFMFEKLEVYQKAVSFADQIAALTQTFPRGFYFLTDQLNRAALSIATNLAEGNGRFTRPDRKNFFTIARGSAQECVPLLEVARGRALIDESTHASLRPELEAIAKMTSGLINGLEKRDLVPEGQKREQASGGTGEQVKEYKKAR